MKPVTRRHALFGALAATALRPALAQAKTPADVALVLALDVSRSVIERRWSLQKAGYATAFLDPDIITRITHGPIGRIAVTVVQWSDCESRKQVVPWTLISDQASGARFATTLANMPRVFEGRTCVGGGLYLSLELLLAAPFEATKRVIDISGDGIQNDTGFLGPESQSLDASAVRERAVASGIVINGLPILLPEDDHFSGENMGVVPFYRKNVISRDGFVVVVRDGNDPGAFADALKQKLLIEIS